MTTTLGEFRGKILRLLGDVDADGYSEDLLLDAIVSSHTAVLPWRPKAMKDESTVIGDGTDVDFALPSDLVEVQAVIVQDTGEVLPQAVFSPGSYHGTGISPTNDWILYPEGYITFSKAIADGGVYSAFWTAPTAMDNDTLDADLEVPDVLITGMVYYAASHALMPSAVGAAELRQFGTRPDTGNPEHNPVRDAVTYLLSAFNREMNRLPEVQRMQTRPT